MILKSRKSLFICASALGAIAIAFSFNLVNTAKAGIPTYAIHGSYTVDVNNPKAVVGDADYVFVGQVVSQDGTVYENKVPMEQENGDITYVGDAYTKYTVSVLSNLKNELITNQDISITKLGGIREDGSAYDVFESDTLPEAGKTYVFVAYTQNDGSLLISGPNSNILMNDSGINANSLDAFANSSVYRTYKSAVRDEIKTSRKTLESNYDADHYAAY